MSLFWVGCSRHRGLLAAGRDQAELSHPAYCHLGCQTDTRMDLIGFLIGSSSQTPRPSHGSPKGSFSHTRLSTWWLEDKNRRNAESQCLKLEKCDRCLEYGHASFLLFWYFCLVSHPSKLRHVPNLFLVRAILVLSLAGYLYPVYLPPEWFKPVARWPPAIAMRDYSPRPRCSIDLSLATFRDFSPARHRTDNS